MRCGPDGISVVASHLMDLAVLIDRLHHGDPFTQRGGHEVHCVFDGREVQ